MNANSEVTDREYDLLLRGYDRISTRNAEEQDRLYHLVIGYIAGAAAALTWLLDGQKDISDVAPIFWIASSIATTLYLVFYSYVSVCLIDSALYQKAMWERLNSAHQGQLVPSWDGFVPPTSLLGTRKLLNLVFTGWRAIALILALTLPLLSLGCGRDMRIASIVAMTFAATVGGFVFCVSTIYVAAAYKHLDVKKQIIKS